jgi:hypothetical protein
MKWTVTQGALLAAAACLCAPAAEAATFDSINGAASPPFVYYGGPVNIGWMYTPTESYNLDGISTYFEPVPNGTGAHTITAQIWSDLPNNGGTLLGQGQFSANSGSGGFGGVSFAPTVLAAGTSYFVDFLNTAGMGVNLGSWALDGNGNPAPSNGATTNLGSWYLDNGNGSAFSLVSDGGSYYTTATGNVSFAEPILYFSGTAISPPVPEPGTFAMLLLGLGAVGVARQRGRARFGQPGV